MGTAPKRPSSAKKPGGREHAPTALTLREMLSREGSPWRPIEESGVLVKAQRKPRNAKAIFAACEQRLISHLRAVCLWPKRQRNESWRAGDYSFYVLSFSPAPKTQLYVQLWSEPDEDGAIFEVSSGAWNPPADAYVDAEKQESLRDHGFEIGGNAENFRKIVAIEDASDLRAIAREAVAVLCKVLRYDGTFNLDYQLDLQTVYAVGHVLASVSPYTLAKLLREWGFAAELKTEDDTPPLVEARTDHGLFGVEFGDEIKEGSGQFQMLGLRAYREAGAEEAESLAERANALLPAVTATVDGDGDVALAGHVLLHGGVTAAHLRARFEMWRWVIGEIAEAKA